MSTHEGAATSGRVTGGAAAAPDAAVSIGVSVPVPAPFGEELADWRLRFGDQRGEDIPAHVTIVPPTPLAGDDEREVVAAVTAHLAEALHGIAPFAIRLAGTDTFRPVSPVTFVRVVEGSEVCDLMQKRARTGVLARDLHYDYHPHVTVAHDVDDAALDRAMQTLSAWSCEFVADHLAVHVHQPDGTWRHAADVELRPLP